jgi:hypothetical protein
MDGSTGLLLEAARATDALAAWMLLSVPRNQLKSERSEF